MVFSPKYVEVVYLLKILPSIVPDISLLDGETDHSYSSSVAVVEYHVARSIDFYYVFKFCIHNHVDSIR